VLLGEQRRPLRVGQKVDDGNALEKADGLDPERVDDADRRRDRDQCSQEQEGQDRSFADATNPVDSLRAGEDTLDPLSAVDRCGELSRS
jgi:hypothetical protein